MKVLVTGSAGFIGFHVVKRLLERGDEVVGLDNINDYYDVNLKYARLAETGITREDIEPGKLVQSGRYPLYRFVRMNLEDRERLPELFAREKFDRVVNLAAQAGVRYSLENPFAYVDSNLVGFVNVLECCRHHGIQHLVYASSSSVYGSNEKVPFSEEDRVDDPVSLYAATKKANELMASCYSKLYGIPATGLRFFTVYGPWGRPDMAPMLFAKAIMNGEPIKVFNKGDLSRDFTYIDDIVEGVLRVLDKVPEGNEDHRHEVYNIGCSSPVKLMDFIECLENALGKKAEKIYLPMQPGDVYRTYADTSKLERETGYKPRVTLKEGVGEFMGWWKNYFLY
ncbi:NAD-dependent epimerase [Butyricimonas synergistica]|uniref:NAD-dependent epimerase n=1 Tax=Butyricimonas synergistica TaxID=544644 RepID=UPI00036BB0CA|nr:NAD-dependent epimerase [Butyricimonas synergistica]